MRGAIDRMGRIADGTTVSDYHVSEKQHQISTQTSLLHATWMDKKLNIIDTPGYLDFMSEALAALRVADFALVIVHAQHGIGVGTERVWNCATVVAFQKSSLSTRWTNRMRVSTACWLTREPITVRECFRSMSQSIPGPRFQPDPRCAPQRYCHLRDDRPGPFREEPAQGEWKERGTQLHRELIELIAESDDTLLKKFFEQGSLSEEEFRTGIHSAMQPQHFIPLFCTSATTDVGVGRLLDFIAKYGSSPIDREKADAEDARSGAELEVKVGARAGAAGLQDDE